MTSTNDFSSQMSDVFSSDAVVDGLLSGGLSPEEAPALLSPLVSLLEDARASVVNAEPDELMIARLAAVVRQDAAASTTPRRRVARIVTMKVVVAGGVLVGATAAAAATGHLPGPIQGLVARSLSHVGISVPESPPAAHAGTGAKPPRSAVPAFHGASTPTITTTTTGQAGRTASRRHGQQPSPTHSSPASTTAPGRHGKAGEHGGGTPASDHGGEHRGTTKQTSTDHGRGKSGSAGKGHGKPKGLGKRHHKHKGAAKLKKHKSNPGKGKGSGRGKPKPHHPKGRRASA